jgi:GAF domain-containing protein
VVSDDLRTVHRILLSARDISARQQAETALREGETRLKLLNGILISLASGVPVQQIVERTVKRLGEYFPGARVAYFSVDNQTQATGQYAVEPSAVPPLLGATLPLLDAPEYLSAWRRREPVIVEDLTHDHYSTPLTEVLSVCRVRAWLAVPVHHPEQLAGLLCFAASTPRAWGEYEATTLTEVADYLSIVIREHHTRQERQRAETQLEHNARKLAALSQMGQAVVGSLDVAEVLYQVIGEVTPLLGAEGVSVLLLSDDQHELIFAAVSGAGAGSLQGQRIPATVGFAGEVLRTRRAIAVSNPEAAAMYHEFENIRGYHLQALLAVPLLARGELIGVMEAVHTQPGALDASALPLLEAAAAWAAIAISNARLHAEALDALARETRLDEVTRTISGAVDLPTILQNVVRLAAELVQAEAGALALLDPNGQSLKVSYLFNLPQSLDQTQVPSEQGLAWQVIKTGQSVLVDDYGDDPNAIDNWVTLGVHGALVVPLIAGEARLGALGLFSLNPEKRFTRRDLTLAESVGRQAGIAIQNARLFEAQRRRVAALTVLHQTGLDLSAQLDLSALLYTIVERSANMLEASMGGLYLLRPDNQNLELTVSLAGPRDYTGTQLRLGEGLAGRVAQSGAALVVGDYSQWAGRAEIYKDTPFRAVVSAPIKWQGQVLGVLNVTDDRPDRFGSDDVEIVRLFADQAAVAIANARQHDNLRRRLQESEAMAAISRALNEILDLGRILQMIVDAARQIIPKVERAVIHLLSEERQALRPAAVAGLDELGRPEFSMRPGEGVAGQVIAEGVVLNIGDTQTDPRYLPLGRATHLLSLLVAPVQSGQRRLGTISIQSAASNAFSSDDEWLLATLGVQAGLAIENVRLFEVERRRAEEAEALQQVTQVLIQQLNLPEMLRAVVEAVATIANYKYVSIYLLDRDRLALQAQKGYAHLFGELQLGQGVVGRVMRTGHPAFVPDVRLDSDYVEAAPAVRSLISVPLVHANRALGVLLVESDADQPLDQHDLDWLSTLGRQLSVAIENTRLVGDLAQALQQEKTARAQMVQSEKLAAMGRLVASVAHELNNPLQAIQNALYLVKQEGGLGAQAREDLQVALTEADRMADLISRLRATYRPARSEEFRPESLNALVEDVRKLITTHLRHNNVSLDFDGEAYLPPVLGLRDQLKQALLNLSLNAVEAMPNGGQLNLRTRYLPDTGGVLLTVSDTGMGIPSEALPNVFDPFFTTKESGTGLGLAITHDIIRRHGGRIEVESEIGQGTSFRVWLPIDNTAFTRHNARSGDQP